MQTTEEPDPMGHGRQIPAPPCPLARAGTPEPASLYSVGSPGLRRSGHGSSGAQSSSSGMGGGIRRVKVTRGAPLLIKMPLPIPEEALPCHQRTRVIHPFLPGGCSDILFCGSPCRLPGCTTQGCARMGFWTSTGECTSDRCWELLPLKETPGLRAVHALLGDLHRGASLPSPLPPKEEDLLYPPSSCATCSV